MQLKILNKVIIPSAIPEPHMEYTRKWMLCALNEFQNNTQFVIN